jgi:hypothetical protein
VLVVSEAAVVLEAAVVSEGAVVVPEASAVPAEVIEVWLPWGPVEVVVDAWQPPRLSKSSRRSAQHTPTRTIGQL